jgi:hypothetical protein
MKVIAGHATRSRLAPPGMRATGITSAMKSCPIVLGQGSMDSGGSSHDAGLAARPADSCARVVPDAIEQRLHGRRAVHGDNFELGKVLELRRSAGNSSEIASISVCDATTASTDLMLDAGAIPAAAASRAGGRCPWPR